MMTIRFLIALCVAAVLGSASGCSMSNRPETAAIPAAHTGYIGVASSVATPQPHIYVANAGRNSILEFGLDANGNVHAMRHLSGKLTELKDPQWIGVDQSEIIYAELKPTKSWPARIGVFTPNQHGDAAPVRMITDAITSHVPVAMAVDPSGTVYLLYSDIRQHFGIDEFPPGANGVLTPFREIAGPNTLLDKAQSVFTVVADVKGGVWWACSGQTGTARVVGYAPAADGDATPAVTLERGPKTLIEAPTELSVDESEYVYVETKFSPTKEGVLVFAPGATGPVAPIRKMRFNGEFHLGSVSAGTLEATGVVNSADALASFDPHKTGLQTPKRVVTGSMTELAGPLDPLIR